jgi:hypothetical protein
MRNSLNNFGPTSRDKEPWRNNSEPRLSLLLKLNSGLKKRKLLDWLKSKLMLLQLLLKQRQKSNKLIN